MLQQDNPDLFNNTVSAEHQVSETCHVSHAYDEGTTVVFFGNSITLHERAPAIGWNNNWGMAASAKEKDYVHVVLRGLCERGLKINSVVVNASRWERHYWDDSLYGEYSLARDAKADVVIFRLGENVDRTMLDTEDFAKGFEAFVRTMSAGAKQVIVTSFFWRYERLDAALRAVADKVGATFVDISDLGDHDENKAIGLFEHAGVASHPGDLGMKRIGERLLEAIL